ncbi:voltage-dependent calcium channel subunit alpha-2/delta-2-like [Lingula anatina]|uniref:Voltage-dependent calcium channel subunit alpha-2/delta-2-like n=1 Tax=Lingula anatina TaxID=7574 RepID=A0A2R2MM07_LINAN|nr:voltage-dependent calcium channel subunit alpha-2/delta-2-like [Lingula anatina]|eukprot:XP_023931087.1 voltage-dependent calcium channel subunit alpha-2/delta-2-like [Lingula anatina]
MEFNIDNYKFNNAKTLDKSTLAYSPKFGKGINETISSVHIPVEIYYGDKDILNGLKWTEGLDDVWKQNAEDDPNLLWQYFGGQKGFLRSYPANAWTEAKPDLYDVRRRPWYTQGSSSPKNMMILVDTSGSTTGEALQLMKETVKQLLETLGENDFVAVANYSKTEEIQDTVRYVSECFQGFVQATHRNKQVLKEAVMDLQASGMAKWEDALEFAFKAFKEFEQDEKNSSMNNVGADCNRIIMVLTDGATAKDEAATVLNRENPDKQIRIFTYAIGKTAAAIEAVRWLACKNRGYFSKIPAMGAIRTTVQEFFTVLNRPLALAYKQFSGWTSVYEDALGLGMMITLTLPVYNRSTDSNNQTILGVMGVDVTTAEMENSTPWQKLGPNGYAFAMNWNGYTVFHPNLKAQLGYLKDPPNVDFLEVEHENPAKIELRKMMINNLTGNANIETFVISKDLRYASEKNRLYFYTGIPNSTFSLGLVMPDYSIVYPEVTGYQAKQLLEPIVADADQMQQGVHAPLWICNSKDIVVDNYNNTNDTETFPPNPVRDMVNGSSSCNDHLVQHFLWDYVTTQNVTEHWKALSQAYKSATEVVFVSTNSGLTRLYPHNMTEQLLNMANPRENQEYKRAIDEDHVLFSAPYKAVKDNDPNTTGPVVSVMKSISMTEKGGNTYKPAVVGAKMHQTYLTELMNNTSQGQCSDLSLTLFCYLIDDGAFIVSTNQEKDEIGRFFGATEPALMMELYNGSSPVYNRVQNYDWQGVCKQLQLKTSAGPRSFFIPSIPVFEMLTVKWWTSSVMWAYSNFNLYNWIFESAKSFAYAQQDPGDGGSEKNESCVTEQVQYYFTDVTSLYSELVCENCTRQYSVEKITGTNLLLVVAEPPCGPECDPLSPEPKRGPYDTREDPDVPAGGPGVCEASRSPRYRLRPQGCYDFDDREEYDKCRGCGLMAPSILFILSIQLAVSLLGRVLQQG